MASDNNTLRKDLGAVSAYAVAVEHGFDGTEAEWEEYIANASNNAAAANTSKLAAEGYAVGKQNGEDVPSTSPYFENNAKYYAEQTEAAKTTAVQAIEAKGEQVLHSIPSEYTELSGDVEDLKSHHNLQIDSIPGTEQTILFDDEGNVRSITHSANGTAVRTDMFTFGDDTIIEVRTLASGEIMTIMTNTDTLVTTVAYTPAE